MPTKHQYFTVELPKGYSADEKEAIAAEIISYIRKRTLEGKGFFNGKEKTFPGSYSESYKNSVNFKAAGKGSKINLRLSGELLSAIELLEAKGNRLKIGFEDGTNENAKADGNIRGTYGKQKPIKGGKYARPFLGLPEKKIQEILSNYPLDDKSETNARAQAVLEAQERVDRYIKGVIKKRVTKEQFTKTGELAREFAIDLGEGVE